MAIPLAQELNELITFQTATGAKLLSGGRATLTTFTTAYARIREIGGFLETETMQLQAQNQRYDVWTRWIDGITGFMQIAWGAKILVIVAPPVKVIDSEGRRWWQIIAEEKQESN